MSATYAPPSGRRRVAAVLAGVGATLLLLAACGGGETTRPAATQPTSKQTVRTVPSVVYEQDADGTRETLTVYAPAGGGPWPTAVMIHGGGNSHLDDWAASVASHGVVVFVPHWPDNAPWPSASAFRADTARITGRLACAVRFAHARAEHYRGDPANLTLFGWSAGANHSSVIAFADQRVAEGCVVASGSIVPDNLVLFEGDWLLGAPFWDELLREDPTVLATLVPWSDLESGKRMPVHVLVSNDPSLCMPLPANSDRWLALRDPGASVRQALARLGALDDGRICVDEVERLMYDRLKSLGYEATYRILPGSTHNYLSDEALQVVANAIWGRS